MESWSEDRDRSRGPFHVSGCPRSSHWYDASMALRTFLCHSDVESTADESAGKVGTIVLRVKKVRLVGAKYSDISQSRPKEVTGKRKAGDIRVAYVLYT